MRPFTPTLGIRETSKNSNAFLREHKDVLWTVLKPLLPWILGLYFMDALVTALYFPDSDKGFILGSLIAGYFFTALVITWHRVVIHGADHYIAMNPFKPKKHELGFIGMAVFLSILGVLLVVAAAILVKINPLLAALGIIAAIVTILYLGFKFCFYFPAKALNNSIKLKDSYELTTGYYWKFMGAVLLAPLKYLVLLILYFVIAFTVLGLVLTTVGNSENIALISNLLGFAISIPVIVYFYPILYVIGVTVLSNYYQHTLQNKK